MEAPSPMVVWGEGDDDENGGFLPEDDVLRCLFFLFLVFMRLLFGRKV
jgi:hypothetical protein